MRRHRLHTVVLTLATATVWAISFAQDGMPKRKPGLWEMSMELPGRRGGGTMKSLHCVDERTDEHAQRRALDESPDARCESHNVRRSAGVYEADYRCTGSRGKTEGHLKLSGDMSSRYTLENKARFDPPRGGMAEATITMQGQWVGACPADMKPGEMRIAGLPMAASGARGDRPRRERQPPSPEQMQKMQEMLEQMKQQRGSR